MRTRIALAAGLAAATALADVPAFVISHEGFLRNADDAPVDGTAHIRFAIYGNSAPQQGEDILWEDTYTVGVHKGHYTVLLGGKLDGGAALLDAGVFSAGQPRWLAIEIESGGELTPRMRIGVVPIALSAQTLGAHPADDFLLVDDADAKYAQLDNASQGVRMKALTLTEANGAPLTVTSTARIANLNADLLDGKQYADLQTEFAPSTGSASYAATAHTHTDYAPATGSTAYAPATGSANYAPATGSANYAPATGSPNYAPATGSANYAPATGSPNYAPATGSANYAPASGSANYVAKAGDGSAAVTGLTVAGRPVVLGNGQVGDASYAGSAGMPLVTANWVNQVSDYQPVSFGITYATRPVLLLTCWEPDGSGGTGARIEAEWLSGFTFYSWSLSAGWTKSNPSGIAYAALPPGTYTSDEGKNVVAAIFDNKTAGCAANCAVNFPSGAFTQPPVVLATIDETYNDGGATHIRIDTTTTTGFTYTASHNGAAAADEYVHWVAADAGILHFGPHLTIGAGSYAAGNANGTIPMTSSFDTFVSPPVVVMTAFREGGTATATVVRVTSWPEKKNVAYSSYSDTASVNTQKVNWLAVDTH